MHRSPGGHRTKQIYEVVIVKQAIKRLICAALCFAMLAGFIPLAAAETGYDRGFDGGMAGTGNIYAHGLDVSAWQESGLNFQNFANAGYDFVMNTMPVQKPPVWMWAATIIPMPPAFQRLWLMQKT